MIIAFIFVSLLGGMFMSYIWSSKGLANMFIKMYFSIYTLWAILMLLGLLWPLIQNGQLKLI